MESPPPSYHQATASECQPVKSGDHLPPYSDPEAGRQAPQMSQEPPPSYDSLFGRVQAAKQSSESKPQLFKKILAIFVGTLGCTICIGLVLAIPVSMIVMGALYKDECPLEKYIPIYLIVGGSFGVLKNLITLCQKAKNDREGEEGEEKNLKSNPFDHMLNTFLVAWFIAGNVWIYRSHSSWQANPASCDSTLYLYAFWLTTSVYIVIGTTCCCICCVGCIASMVK